MAPFVVLGGGPQPSLHANPGAWVHAAAGTQILLLRTRAVALYRAGMSATEGQLAGKQALFVGFAAQRGLQMSN